MYTFFNIYNSSMASAPLCDRIFRTKNSSHHISKSSHIHIGSSSHADRPESYKGWSTSALHKACDSVHGGMSIRRAAEEYDIPKSTLFDYTSGRVDFGAKSGAKQYLTKTEEELVTFLNGMSSIGYSRTMKQVVQLVQTVVTKKVCSTSGPISNRTASSFLNTTASDNCAFLAPMLAQAMQALLTSNRILFSKDCISLTNKPN